VSTPGARRASIKEKFAKVYGREPHVVSRAPGRVNLIGEHTDYNEGYVLPIAIDYDVLIAAAQVPGPDVRLYSLDFDSSSSFRLDNIACDMENKWTNYVRGVAAILQQRRKNICGADIAIQGNVPLGAGLSSSAALEVATAMAFQALYGFELSGPEMALVCQAAEHAFAGVKCGIMDQFVSRLGAEDHALFVDCRTLEYELVPLPSQKIRVIVTNTMVKHELGDSGYNTRRAECDEAVSILKHRIPGITALRDVTRTDLTQYGDELPEVVLKRAEHVVAENTRVLESVDALNRNQIEHFGELINQSHDSLRDLYEVSCEELDILVDAARQVPGVYGTRMTGGGFGGCTVSLVAEDALDEFLERVPADYKSRTGITPEIYICTPKAGAEILPEG